MAGSDHLVQERGPACEAGLPKHRSRGAGEPAIQPNPSCPLHRSALKSRKCVPKGSPDHWMPSGRRPLKLERYREDLDLELDYANSTHELALASSSFSDAHQHFPQLTRTYINLALPAAMWDAWSYLLGVLAMIKRICSYLLLFTWKSDGRGLYTHMALHMGTTAPLIDSPDVLLLLLGLFCSCFWGCSVHSGLFHPSG